MARELKLHGGPALPAAARVVLQHEHALHLCNLFPSLLLPRNLLTLGSVCLARKLWSCRCCSEVCVKSRHAGYLPVEGCQGRMLGEPSTFPHPSNPLSILMASASFQKTDLYDPSLRFWKNEAYIKVYIHPSRRISTPQTSQCFRDSLVLEIAWFTIPFKPASKARNPHLRKGRIGDVPQLVGYIPQHLQEPVRMAAPC